VKVKLADGKERNIQHMMATTFWHPDGTPMSAQQFMELLFGKLPDFFSNEEELRNLWSAPDTRTKLLQGLAEKGFGHDQLAEMQKIYRGRKKRPFRCACVRRLCNAAAHPRGSRREGEALYQLPFHRQAVGLLGLRAVTLCDRWGGRTRAGKADPTASP
jgi:hypothetical protein